jgi:hypothetical protein
MSERELSCCCVIRWARCDDRDEPVQWKSPTIAKMAEYERDLEPRSVDRQQMSNAFKNFASKGMRFQRYGMRGRTRLCEEGCTFWSVDGDHGDRSGTTTVNLRP